MKKESVDIKVSNEDFKKLRHPAQDPHFYKFLLKNNQAYEHVKKWFNNEFEKEAPVYGVRYVSENGSSSVGFTKTTVIYALSRVLLMGETQRRYEELRDLISFDSFKRYYGDKEHVFNLEEKEIKIPINKFIKLLEMGEREFKLFMTKDISNDKKIFIYGFRDFWKREMLNARYIFPEDIHIRIIEWINSNRYIDILALEAFNDNKNKGMFNNIKINEEYLRYLLEDVNKYSSKLEKAAHVYIKMCKSLTYSERYYALENRERTLDINRLEEVDLYNNEVVCFEFNAIFAKVLSVLGIEYLVDSDIYGKGHAFLIFRDGDFVVEADSVEHIFDGDLFACKVSKPLKGFCCKNSNPNTLKRFNNILNNIYNLEYSKDGLIQRILKEEPNIKEMRIKERIEVFYEIVDSSDFKKMDLLSLIQNIKRSFFDDFELHYQFQISYVSNNNNGVNIIFVVNDTSFIDNIENNVYFIKQSGENITKINSNELEMMFKNGDLSLINTNSISGINTFCDKKIISVK